MKKLDPVFILINALKCGCSLADKDSATIYKLFGPEDLEKGEPGLYFTSKGYLESGNETWFNSDLTFNALIKKAYSLSEEELITLAANNALNKLK